MVTRYIQQGIMWIPEHHARPRGLGDVVSRLAARVGITASAGCGCSSRRAWLNRAVPFPRRGPAGPAARRRGHPPIIAGGAPGCTPGTDCFCDCVRGPDSGNGFKNGACQSRGTYVSTAGQNPEGAAALLFCEDLEAPTLRANQGLGDAGPYYGPPHDDTGFTGNLGVNSYWNRIYGPGAGTNCCGEGNFMTNGTTILGKTCSPQGFPNDRCWGPKVWNKTNLWNVNTNGNPRIFVVEDDSFGAEVAGILPLTGKSGGGAGAFDGAASLAHRIGIDDTSNGHGQVFFPQNVNAYTTSPGVLQRELGITMALGYPNNLFTAGVIRSGTTWKHNEFGPGDSGILVFGDGQLDQFPFYGFFFRDFGQADICVTALANATGKIGSFECNGNGIIWHAPGSLYQQSVDFPLGAWGCVQGHYRNIGLATMEWDIWFTGPAGVRKHLIAIRNFDGRFLQAKDGLSYFFYDTYANTNNSADPPPGYTPTTEVTYRYEDNTVMRAGAPVSCAQIGFGSVGGGSVDPRTPYRGVSMRSVIHR